MKHYEYRKHEFPLENSTIEWEMARLMDTARVLDLTGWELLQVVQISGAPIYAIFRRPKDYTTPPHQTTDQDTHYDIPTTP